MDTPRPIFWHQGLFLQPHHFQMLERSFATQLHPFFRYQCPSFFGMAALDIQKAALNTHSMYIMSGEFVFPDGTYAVHPGNCTISPRSFENSWIEGGKPLKVFLGVKKWQKDAGNVSQIDSYEEAFKHNTRYVTLKNPEWVPDMHGGSTDGEVKFLSHVLKIFWESELDELGSFSLLPIAELVRDGDQIVLSQQFIPPCLCIHASSHLVRIITEIKNQLIFRCRQLEEYKQDRGIQSATFGSKDMVFLMALRSLARHIPGLMHVLETESVHPWHVYGLLRQLIGELSTFSAHINALGEENDGRQTIPAYDHTSLWKCFSSAQQCIARLLDEITAGPDYIHLLEFDGTFYTTDIKPEAFTSGNRFYLVLTSEDDTADIAEAMSTLAKASSRERLPILIARALPGVGIDHLPVPPQELPRRPQSIYFALNQHGEQWNHVVQSKNLSVYWDDAPPDLTMELMIVGRT
ncbi:MAG: type VI secretion system baseplate subunit TssK [Desulfovermiculus sp.]|nr:type VI secretion system baseplate subunit TssK [Desulfovermiculus sp.]